MVDKYASSEALSINTELEFERNQERYKFLKWGQKNLENFRVIPPGVGICHQVNMEFLAKVVWHNKKDNTSEKIEYGQLNDFQSLKRAKI